MHTRLLVSALLVGFTVARTTAQTVGTAFTYQGRLRSNGQAATGPHDLRFRLFDAAVGGNQVGATVCVDNAAITPDGTFVASLDFGSLFNGSALYLQVSVRADAGLACGNTTGYTILSPRQAVTGAPFALGPWQILPAGGGLSYAGRVGIGTEGAAPLGPLDVRSGTASYVRVDPLYGDLHVNGGADGYFGIYNQGGPAGRTEIIGSSNNIILSAGNTGCVGLGVLPVSGVRLAVSGDLFLLGAGSKIMLPPTTRTKSIHGAAFLPARVNDGQSGGVAAYDPSGVTGSIGDGDYLAAIELPHGASITNVVMYYIDTNPGQEITVRLGRTALTTGAAQNIATMTSSWISPSVRSTPATLIAGGTVDNATYVYWAAAHLDHYSAAIHKLVGLRIDYSVSQPLP